MFPSSFVECYQSWLTWLKVSKGGSKHTCLNYACDVHAFLVFLAQHTNDTITMETIRTLEARDIRAFLSHRLNNHVSHRTLARNLSALKSFMLYLESERGLQTSAFAHLTLPRIPKKMPRPMTFVNITKILDATGMHTWVHVRDRAIFMLLYGSGLRISEALGLRIRDIADTLIIRGKGQKDREVPMLAPCRQAIECYRAQCPFPEESERLLFLGARGGKLSAGVIQQSLRRVRRLLNLPDEVTPHALRHSFASHLLGNGANLREIQTLLGHANLSSTQQYVDVNMEQLVKIHSEAHPREEGILLSESKKSIKKQ
ncbi:MAG: tyrosine recombinase XerC [Alphaproteobacteria bacterium]|nr:MAG: tyrosine recombinase XerC [Alphaproteobacteria bacterium]